MFALQGEKSRRKKRTAERSRKDSSSELSADSDVEGVSVFTLFICHV